MNVFESTIKQKYPKIILVRPSHPGNIGAVARAMKNMGLTDLCLVNPVRFPHAEATARASGADDILESATICLTLDEALASCHFVVTTSARVRHISRSLYAPRECAKILTEEYAECDTALVFGTESSGLTNAEMALSHAQVYIPTSAGFSSLNLASAVQIMAYELFIAQEQEVTLSQEHKQPVAPKKSKEIKWATAQEKLGCIQHLEFLLKKIHFSHFSNIEDSRLFMQRLYRFFHRVPLEIAEVHMLRGIFSAIEKQVKKS